MRGAVLVGWLEDVSGLVRLLAVLGGAALGAVVIGFLTQVLSRALTTKKLPPWAANVVRLLGGVVVGWLVALWLFGGEGPGIGGTGGMGFGSGAGKGASTAKDKGSSSSPTTARPATAQPAVGEALRVEVLGRAALEKLARGGAADAARCYRVEADGGPRLLTLPEVKDYVRGRLKEKPPLRRVTIVLYNDSPARDVPLVSELRDWARDLVTDTREKMKVDFVAPDANAPVS
jgi:hypothetical protein